MELKTLMEENKEKGYEAPNPPLDWVEEYFKDIREQTEEDIERFKQELQADLDRELDRPSIKYMPLWAGFVGGLLALIIQQTLQFLTTK